MIKIFHSINEAINQRSDCPYCKCQMQISSKDLTIKNAKRNIIFKLLGKDLLSIDLDSEKIDIITNEESEDHIKYKYNGINYERLILECYDCCQYSYTLQLKIDTSQLKVVNVVLNSEFFSVEENNILYEIKNNYSKSNTSFSYYVEDECKSYSLPLVTLDVDNPLQSLNKIKKLIIFS